MRCSMRRCEGHIWSNEGCCWFPASGCAAQNACRDMWCRVVPRWTVQKPCRAFLKRTNWKKKQLFGHQNWPLLRAAFRRCSCCFVELWCVNLTKVKVVMKRPRTRESAHGALLRTSGAGNAQIPETARDVANLRSSQSQKFTKGFCFPLLFQAIPMGMSRMQKIMLSMLSWPMNANECQWAQSHLWKMLTISIDC